MIRTYKQLPQ